MRTRATSLLFALLLRVGSATHASAQSTATVKPFEGTITMAMSFPGDSSKHEALINLADGRFEMEIDLGLQGQIKLFPDQKAHKMYMAMMSMNHGQELPLPPDDSADWKNVKMNPTGKTMTISKHKASGFMVNDPQADYTFWATKDLSPDIRDAMAQALPHLMQGDPVVRSASAWLAAQNLTPIRIELLVKVLGNQKVSVEFTKATPKKLDPSVFERPKGMEFTAPPPPPGGPNSGPSGGPNGAPAPASGAQGDPTHAPDQAPAPEKH